MDLCCLVCRSSEVDQLISMSCVTSTSRKSISEMLDVFVKIRPNQMLLDVVPLPEMMCDQCLDKLDRAYRLWKRSRSVGLIKKCDRGVEDQYRVCRMCAATTENELVSMFCFSKDRRIQIAWMVEYLVDVKVKRSDRLPPYICIECLKDLNEGYGFKKEACDSIKFFQEQSLHPWQKMEFRTDCPKRLVVELSCEGTLNLDDKTSVTCSVCSSRNRLERLERACRGCRLEFRNYEEIHWQIEEHKRLKAEEEAFLEVFNDIVDYNDLEYDQQNLDLELEVVFDDADYLSVEKEYLLDMLQRSKREATERPKVSSNEKLIKTIIEYKCCIEGCSQYGTAEDLRKHFEEVHPATTSEVFSSPFKCPICDTCFHDSGSLKSHNGETSPLYKCNASACPFVTRSRACATRHMESAKDGVDHHGQTKPISLEHFGKFYIVGEPLDVNSFTLERLHERCCWCGEPFEELHELEAHRELMHDVVKAPFQCKTCNKPFKSLTGLSHHHQRKSLRTHYYCQPCKKTFWDLAPFNMHRNVEHSDVVEQSIQDLYESAFLCCGCDDTFPTKEDLEEHRLQSHSREDEDSDEQLRCNLCAQSFPTNKELRNHFKKYQNIQVYCCIILSCIFKTPKLSLIKNHVTTGCHTKSDGKTMTIRRVNPSIFFCCISHCPFEHSSYEEIIKHVAETHEKKRQNHLSRDIEAVSFRCEACFKSCRSQLGLINHKNGRNKLSCTLCRRSLPRREFLAHKELCQRKHEQKCELCDEILVTRRKRADHMRSKHGVILPSVGPSQAGRQPKSICNICGAMVEKKNLDPHMLSHENKRIFTCDQCHKSFNTPMTLYCHIKNVHSSSPLYPCREGCDRRYKNSGDRVRHEQLVHLGIKPFVCHVCSASFVRDRDLRLHSKKHTGRKLYACDHCGADYDRLSDFKEHQRTCGKDGMPVDEDN